MLSDERFSALLRGEEPINEDEVIWLKNYRERQHKAFLEMQAREEAELKQKLEAYRAFYQLVRETFPKNYFCKNPIPEDEYKVLKNYCFDKYGDKITAILESPVQRTIYLIPPKHPSGDDYSYVRYLEDKFLLREIKKRYGVDITLKSLEFKKYATSEFIEKTRAINKKYNAIISTSFSAYDYLTDYERYNV